MPSFGTHHRCTHPSTFTWTDITPIRDVDGLDHDDPLRAKILAMVTDINKKLRPYNYFGVTYGRLKHALGAVEQGHDRRINRISRELDKEYYPQVIALTESPETTHKCWRVADGIIRAGIFRHLGMVNRCR